MGQNPRQQHRLELDAILRSYCPNVYYQPPESIKLKYPCIIYAMDALKPEYADNLTYLLHIPYSMRYITRDADDETVFKLATLPKCKHGKPYGKDNLYHHPYTIYY